MVLEYSNQRDLNLYIHQKPKKRLKEFEAFKYLDQILNAFKKIHEKKVIHRDFKLQNIFLHNNQVKIGDFGFSKITEDNTSSYLGTFIILGTPLTMAPEVLNGKPYNHKADLYSLGVVYY